MSLLVSDLITFFFNPMVDITFSGEDLNLTFKCFKIDSDIFRDKDKINIL